MSPDERDASPPPFEVGLRRVPELDRAPIPDDEPSLVARIEGEIRASGPMTAADQTSRVKWAPRGFAKASVAEFIFRPARRS